MWTNILKFILALLNREALPPVPKPAPVDRREITNAKLMALLKRRFPDANIRLSDNTTQLCDIADIEAFLKVDETNRVKYIAEQMDCDDFAFALLGQFSLPPWSGMAFGFIWSDLHAMNICVDSNLDIWLIEPQNDSVKSELEAWQGKTVVDVFI